MKAVAHHAQQRKVGIFRLKSSPATASMPMEYRSLSFFPITHGKALKSANEKVVASKIPISIGSNIIDQECPANTEAAIEGLITLHSDHQLNGDGTVSDLGVLGTRQIDTI